MAKMMHKVNRTEVVFFSSSDWRDAKEAYDLWVKANVAFSPVSSGNAKIAVFFDEDEDSYRVTLMRSGTETIEAVIYGWDELSQFIHDNM